MKKYRTVKTLAGKKIRVEMTADEIRQRRTFTVCLIASPLLMIITFAIAGGML